MIASANLTRRSLRQQAREDIAGYLFLLPWIIGFLVFHAGAIFASFGLSLFDTDLLSPAKFIGLGNYLEMFFEDPLFWQSLKVSALYTLGSVPLQMLLGLGLALLLNQRVAGRGFWRTVFYLPSVVSGVAIAMIWSWFYHPDLGLFNNALLSIGIEGPRWLFSEVWALPSLILMNVWSVGPVMLIFLAGLQSIQKEFYEAAQIDGAGRRQQFWRITVPIRLP